MTVGIYGIFDSINNECLYVGLSRNIEERWNAHKKDLKFLRHKRDNFNVWFKDHDCNFESIRFEILEECEPIDKVLNLAEIKWFNELKPLFYGKEPSENEKWLQTTETKAKISLSIKNNFSRNPENLLKYFYSCKGCFETFKGSSKKEKYCSTECYKNALKRYDDSDIARAIELYSSGLSLREVASHFDFSHITVRNILESENIVLRGHGTQPSTFKRKIFYKNCIVCRNEFEAKKKHIASCSPSCASILGSANRLGVTIEELLLRKILKTSS